METQMFVVTSSYCVLLLSGIPVVTTIAIFCIEIKSCKSCHNFNLTFISDINNYFDWSETVCFNE